MHLVYTNVIENEKEKPKTTNEKWKKGRKSKRWSHYDFIHYTMYEFHTFQANVDPIRE